MKKLRLISLKVWGILVSFFLFSLTSDIFLKNYNSPYTYEAKVTTLLIGGLFCVLVLFVGVIKFIDKRHPPLERGDILS